MSEWSVERARRVYAVEHWGEGYFDVGDDGRMRVLPHGEGGPSIALDDAVDRARAEGLKLPLLLRFSDILGHRLGRHAQISLDVLNLFDRKASDIEYWGGACTRNEALQGRCNGGIDGRLVHPLEPRSLRASLRIGF